MDLRELFEPDDLLIDFDPVDKWDAIEQLVAHLVERGRIPAESSESIREAVLLRERSMSTGMERGIALPHAAVDDVSKVAACLGVIGREDGLAFESIDAQPARLVVLLVIPRDQKLLHIRTLADLARVLGNDAVRKNLLEAGAATEAWDALCSAGV